MTKKQAVKDFQRLIMHRIVEKEKETGFKDWPRRRTAWNDFTEFLHRERKISDNQVNNWTHPRCVKP